MSLEQAALISQIISAVAVIASLIFVGFQLSQHTRAVRASTSQAHSATYVQALTGLFDGEMASIWRRGLSDFDTLDDDEKVRFMAFTSSIFRFYEASYVQMRRGQLDPAHWRTVEQQLASIAGQPGIGSWWRLRRAWHSEDFQSLFESVTRWPSDALYPTVKQRARPPRSKADGPSD